MLSIYSLLLFAGKIKFLKEKKYLIEKHAENVF
jgi:hypothetical protein